MFGNHLLKSMSKKLVSISDNTSTKCAPRPIFDHIKIPRVGTNVLSEQPLPTACNVIARGLQAIKNEDALLMKLWIRLTGLDA